MISFIIIGRNEGERLRKCLESVDETLEKNSFHDAEVIYVDSNSTDNSIDIATSFKGTRIFKIISPCNAAVARNIGALESIGDVLVFVDGDMEIIPGFFKSIFDENSLPIYEFISGQWENYYYDNKGNLSHVEKYHKKLNKDKFQTTTGGLFIISKKLWSKVGGMDTKFMAGEDLDLGLRLSKIGVKLLRKKELMAKHHTIHYFSIRRVWKDLFQGKTLYSRSLLYRKHLFNKYIYKRIIRSEPTTIIFLFIVLFVLINKQLAFFLIYLISIVVLISLKNHKNIIQFLNRIPYQIVRDIYTIFGFVLFFPENVTYNYEKIRY